MIDAELTERERFVYENYPAMTYKAIAAELGVSPSRIRDIKLKAERKIRDAKLQEQARERNKQMVTIEIPRGMCFVIFRSLDALREIIIAKKGSNIRMRLKEGVKDPDYELTQKVEKLIWEQIK